MSVRRVLESVSEAFFFFFNRTRKWSPGPLSVPLSLSASHALARFARPTVFHRSIPLTYVKDALWNLSCFRGWIWLVLAQKEDEREVGNHTCRLSVLCLLLYTGITFHEIITATQYQMWKVRTWEVKLHSQGHRTGDGLQVRGRTYTCCISD